MLFVAVADGIRAVGVLAAMVVAVAIVASARCHGRS